MDHGRRHGPPQVAREAALELLYGQVIKAYRRRKLAKVERRMQLGERRDLKKALQRLGFSGSINTAFVERLNLTLRQGLAALTRRSWATAQLTLELEAHLKSGVPDLRCYPDILQIPIYL
jgi:hypothetical protein